MSRKQFIITKTDLFNEETAPKDFAWRLFNISQIITTVKVFGRAIRIMRPEAISDESEDKSVSGYGFI